MRTVYLRGKKIRLDPATAIGEGGEAEVFAIGGGRALKVYKGPDHPDFAHRPEERDAVCARLSLRAAKLRDFPRAGLPATLVAPGELATDRAGREIVGYAMPLVVAAAPLARYGEPAFRASGVPPDRTVRLLCALHDLLAATHRAGIVVGDLNDQNVLVREHELPYLIDCDSYQFGHYQCDVYTERFLDPLLCDPASGLAPARPFSQASDWYAFAAMAMQCLLFVGPYGGVHRPRGRESIVPPSVRPLYRITVFHHEVVYPRPALPYHALPDELLHHLHLVFAKDLRVAFPRSLLASLVWSRCPLCGFQHARGVCPRCAQTPPARNGEVVRGRGVVLARTVVRGRGAIVAATLDGDGALRWLAHDAGAYAREDGRVVLSGPLTPSLRFRLQGRVTLVGDAAGLRVLTADGVEQRLNIEEAGGEAAFDANERHRFWIEGGRLHRDGRLGPELVGEVLAGQTRIFVGPTFGLGFYRAGGLFRAFVFDGERRGVNDGVRLPPIAGRLLASRATLSTTRAWFFLALERGGRVVHRVAVLTRDGALLAATEAEREDGSWLGAAGAIRGSCALADALFVPTDLGLLRIELSDGQPQCNSADASFRLTAFPDTAPFVNDGSRLLAGASGLFVVGEREIVQLTLQQEAMS